MSEHSDQTDWFIQLTLYYVREYATRKSKYSGDTYRFGHAGSILEAIELRDQLTQSLANSFAAVPKVEQNPAFLKAAFIKRFSGHIAQT